MINKEEPFSVYLISRQQSPRSSLFKEAYFFKIPFFIGSECQPVLDSPQKVTYSGTL